MALNLISVFLRWVKQIFRIGLREKSPDGDLTEKEQIAVALPPEETSKETLKPEEEPANIPLSGERVIISPEGEKATREKLEESAESEETPIKKGSGKPYRKKSPTEEKKGGTEEPRTSKGKPPVPDKREPIFLGDLSKRRRGSATERRESPKSEDAVKEITDNRSEEEKTSAAIESPFLEMNLDNANVWLVLPQQELKSDALAGTSIEGYSIDLNGKSIKKPISVITDRAGLSLLKEERILLEEPLVKFQVVFPSELQGRKYEYRHKSNEVYTFIAVGNNRGRFYYLNDKDGNVNVLPGREMWVLVHEDFELQTEPEVIEEKWIWNQYQPLRVNLGEVDHLVVKNKKSGEQRKFFSASTFRLEGEQLIKDDFKKECPLFAGKVLRIVAPHENQSGWNVWTLHKGASARIVCKDWTGCDCLSLKLPEELPCEFGEFQVVICEQGKRVPEETLFFRLMPPTELAYQTELIVPDPKIGHVPSFVSIKIDSTEQWKLNPKVEERFESTGHNSYRIEVLPKKETVQFSVAISGRPESDVNFRITIPRLKWRTSNQKEWQSKVVRISRKNLKPGEPFYLLIRTNDLENKYDVLAILETDGRKVQEGKFSYKGVECCLELNEFFDTIKQNKRELVLRIEIRKARESRLLGSIVVLHSVTTKLRKRIQQKRNHS